MIYYKNNMKYKILHKSVKSPQTITFKKKKWSNTSSYLSFPFNFLLSYFFSLRSGQFFCGKSLLFVIIFLCYYYYSSAYRIIEFFFLYSFFFLYIPGDLSTPILESSDVVLTIQRTLMVDRILKWHNRRGSVQWKAYFFRIMKGWTVFVAERHSCFSIDKIQSKIK